MNEEWRSIPGYEGLYEVSNDGQVRRLAGSPKCRKTRTLKLNPTPKGYVVVALSKRGVVTNVEVHRLVMWAFVGEQGVSWVNHINGIKVDNHLENLEYVTPGENLKHAYATGLMPPRYGSKNPAARTTESIVREILALYKAGVSRKELRTRFSLSQTTIQGIVTRSSWGHVYE